MRQIKRAIFLGFIYVVTYACSIAVQEIAVTLWEVFKIMTLYHQLAVICSVFSITSSAIGFIKKTRDDEKAKKLKLEKEEKYRLLEIEARRLQTITYSDTHSGTHLRLPHLRRDVGRIN